MKEKKIRISVRDITLMAMLIAIEIVLSRFCSIQAWNVKIGFAFIAPVTAAILMGPAQAAVVAGVADVLGTLMFPIGPYFPGFTLNSCLNGLVWGLFLHKQACILFVAQFVTISVLQEALFKRIKGIFQVGVSAQ